MPRPPTKQRSLFDQIQTESAPWLPEQEQKLIELLVNLLMSAVKPMPPGASDEQDSQ